MFKVPFVTDLEKYLNLISFCFTDKFTGELQKQSCLSL
jgi:hypothetical protein